MTLILRPSIKDCTREEMEDYIAAIRAKRMVATIEYHNTKNMKLIKASAKVQARVDRQVEMLEKELYSLERAEIKVEDRLNAIEALKQEVGNIMEGIIDPNMEGAYDDE